MYAADGGHTEIVEILIAGGVDVNAKDDDGITALRLAARRGYTEIEDLLETAGAQK